MGSKSTFITICYILSAFAGQIESTVWTPAAFNCVLDAFDPVVVVSISLRDIFKKRGENCRRYVSPESKYLKCLFLFNN